jgi:hypothetical protein
MPRQLRVQYHGAAWPGMFQHGPKGGLPPGNQCSTAGYGLFESLALKEVFGAKEVTQQKTLPGRTRNGVE